MKANLIEYVPLIIAVAAITIVIAIFVINEINRNIQKRKSNANKNR